MRVSPSALVSHPTDVQFPHLSACVQLEDTSVHVRIMHLAYGLSTICSKCFEGCVNFNITYQQHQNPSFHVAGSSHPAEHMYAWLGVGTTISKFESVPHWHWKCSYKDGDWCSQVRDFLTSYRCSNYRCSNSYIQHGSLSKGEKVCLVIETKENSDLCWIYSLKQ